MRKLLILSMFYLTALGGHAQFETTRFVAEINALIADSSIEAYWYKIKYSDQTEVSLGNSVNYDSVMQSNLIEATILLKNKGLNTLSANNYIPVFLYSHNRISASVKRFWPNVEECLAIVEAKRKNMAANIPNGFDLQYLMESLFLTVYDKSIFMDNKDSLFHIMKVKMPKPSYGQWMVDELTHDYINLRDIRRLKDLDTVGSWYRTQILGMELQESFHILKKSDGNYYCEYKEGSLVYPKRLLSLGSAERFMFADDFMDWCLVVKASGELELVNDIGLTIIHYRKINNLHEPK